MDDRSYFDAIFAVVRRIPRGNVMSYSQVGAHAGGVTARTVGWAMANALDGDVPWHRVVGFDGYLRIGRRSILLQDLQRRMLEREGVVFLDNGCVDMSKHQVDAIADCDSIDMAVSGHFDRQRGAEKPVAALD
jgi:methylated-DNA-protein-cysteine methyltransferase-like protein